MTGVWESSEWLLQPRAGPVLPPPAFRLTLGICVLNSVLWLTTAILQIIVLIQVEYNGSGYTIVCITAIWSIILLLATSVSIYGLILNTLKELKSFLIVKAISSFLSVIVFILNIVVLDLDTTDDRWTAGCGFGSFTGLYVFGEGCIMIIYLFSQWRSYEKDVEERRMDRLRQAIEQQQQEHLEDLTRSTIPSLSLSCAELYDLFDLDKSDRLSYTQPVFV